jgi:hypothetical protein
MIAIDLAISDFMKSVLNHSNRLIFGDEEAEIMRSTSSKSQDHQAITHKGN